MDIKAPQVAVGMAVDMELGMKVMKKVAATKHLAVVVVQHP